MAGSRTINCGHFAMRDDACGCGIVTTRAAQSCVRAALRMDVIRVNKVKPHAIGLRIKPAEAGKLMAIKAIFWILCSSN